MAPGFVHRLEAPATSKQMAVEVYEWRRHADDPDSYWLTSHQAAELLGVSRQRLGQLGDEGFVTCTSATRTWCGLPP